MIRLLVFCSIGLVIYTYVVYPVILFLFSRLLPRRRMENTVSTPPRVAILCAMFNEEKVVREKIHNFMKLNYEQLRIYIGSDGSFDGTNDILESYRSDDRIRVFLYPRRGKVHVMNDLMREVQEEILVFTDANSMFEPNAVQKLVAPFVEREIGVTCGRLVLLEESGKSGEGFYWRFETFIKKAESLFNCVIGANGAIYAIRRVLVAPLPATTINDDFTISMRALAQGYGVRYVEEAVATEETHPDDTVEFRRHIRDAAGHYRAIVYLKSLLNPFHPKRFFFYVSHRVIRWFVPHLLVLLLVLPLFALDDGIIRAVYFLQLVFYALALVGYLLKTKAKCFYIPFYFLYINLALMIGFLKNMIGTQKVMWDSTKR